MSASNDPAAGLLDLEVSWPKLPPFFPWAEYKMSLRIRLLRLPASLDVGDAEGVDLHSDPLHFFHCRSSQGQFIRRHDHIRDALHDMIGVAVRDQTTPLTILR